MKHKMFEAVCQYRWVLNCRLVAHLNLGFYSCQEDLELDFLTIKFLMECWHKRKLSALGNNYTKEKPISVKFSDHTKWGVKQDKTFVVRPLLVANIYLHISKLFISMFCRPCLTSAAATPV